MNLSLNGISVKYSHKTVLKSVTTEFASGQIHMLLGENGAGKSTLTKIICGDILPTEGQIFINGTETQIKSPHDGIKNGIVCVHQRPLLAESISIMENLILGVQDFNKNKAEELLKFWMPETKSNTLVKNIGGDQRFFTSLCSALLKNPKLLILDEPSALLDLQQREILFLQLQSFAKNGMNIIVITHNMDEAKKYADTITYLKDGVITEPDSSFLNQDLNAIDSKKLSAENKTDIENKGLIYKAEKLNSRPLNKPAIFDISFEAKAGEITLICGAAESGRESLEDLICGMDSSRSTGTVLISDKKRNFRFKIKNGNFSRRKMEKSDFTFGIIPSNKNFRGSNPQLTVLQLLTSGIRGRKRELENYAEKLIKKADINIKTYEKASCLSGGMLQRLILEREIEKNPDIMILCEPVQGLDVLSAQKLCETLKKLAKQGKIILVLSSSEFPKEICEKTYILQDGFIA